MAMMMDAPMAAEEDMMVMGSAEAAPMTRKSAPMMRSAPMSVATSAKMMADDDGSSGADMTNEDASGAAGVPGAAAAFLRTQFQTTPLFVKSVLVEGDASARAVTAP
jgi:hypothetical protein